MQKQLLHYGTFSELTGTGTTVHCRCASRPLKGTAVSATLAPSSGDGDVSSTRLTHNADRGVAAHPWDRHLPTAGGFEVSTAVTTGSQGQQVPEQLTWASHPQGPTTEVTPLRQRSNLLQSVVFRADVERVLPVPEPQQHGPIPVWAAPRN